MEHGLDTYGWLLANDPLAVVDINVGSEELRSLAEITLALLLFSDAARVNLGVLRHDSGIPVRLLLIGLPLSIAVGWAIAALLFPALDPLVAATVAAAVAPTDAALGAPVVMDTHVPERIRRVLNVESGLNDGIATPFVTFFVAGGASELVSDTPLSAIGALGDLAIGVGVGTAIGLGGGFLLAAAIRRGWSAAGYRAMTVLALALLAYSTSLELGGNGFIAAFVGGLTFGSVPRPSEQTEVVEFDGRVGELLSLLVWFLFGASLVPHLDDTTWETVVFAVLALTVMRMVPVAIALIGTHLDRSTVLFVGWFGPRGLASVVFGIIAFDSLVGPEADTVLVAVTLTVLLSVVAHGVTARPLARRYGRVCARLAGAPPEHAAVPPLPPRPWGGMRRLTPHGHTP